MGCVDGRSHAQNGPYFLSVFHFCDALRDSGIRLEDEGLYWGFCNTACGREPQEKGQSGTYQGGVCRPPLPPCRRTIAGCCPPPTLEGAPGQGCFRREGTSEAATEAVRQAVGGRFQGGYCRLQISLKLALAVRETVAGHRLGSLERGGGVPHPPSNASLFQAMCAIVSGVLWLDGFWGGWGLIGPIGAGGVGLAHCWCGGHCGHEGGFNINVYLRTHTEFVCAAPRQRWRRGSRGLWTMMMRGRKSSSHRKEGG